MKTRNVYRLYRKIKVIPNQDECEETPKEPPPYYLITTMDERLAKMSCQERELFFGYLIGEDIEGRFMKEVE